MKRTGLNSFYCNTIIIEIMKIFVTTIPNKIKIEQLTDFLISQQKEKKLFSDEGVFKLEGGKYKKMKINDDSGIICKQLQISSDPKIIVELCVDKSSEEYDYEDYHKIPFHHKVNEFNIYTYSLRKNAVVELKICLDRLMKVIDMYFETSFEYNHPSVIEDMKCMLYTALNA